MERARRWGGVFAAGCSVVALLAACNAILGNDKRSLEAADAGDASTDTAIADAPAGDDGTSDAVACGDAGDPGDGGALCDGKIVYVSVNGNDANSGCSPCAPKRRIKAAIDALDHAVDNKTALAGYEIHVCAGTYAESSLVLDAPVSIKGAFSCADWTQTATYGYPSFDATNATLLVNATPAQNADTLTIEGNLVDATTAIDGLQITANDAAHGAAALVITGGAKPTVTNVKLQGGASVIGARTDAASFGLYVDTGSGGEISKSEIHGGAGNGGGTTTGSVGVFVGQSAAPNLHDLTIDGGKGTSTKGVGAIGLDLFGANIAESIAVKASTITGGASGSGVIGVFASQGAVFLEQDDIRAGTVQGAPPYLSAGIVGKDVALTLDRDRVLGAIGGNTSTGVQVSGGGAFKAINNLVHGGEASFTHAIDLDVANGYLGFNTLYGGGGANDSTAIAIGPGATNQIASSNLLLGDFAQKTAGNPGSLAIDSTTCPAGSPVLFDKFLDNASAGVTNVAGFASVCGGEDVTMDGFAQHISLGTAVVTGNVGVVSACGGDAGASASCVAIAACDGASKNACLSAIFTSWSTSDDGVTSLFANPPGWSLNAKVPCAVALGGNKTHDPTEEKDYLGVARSENAIGAIDGTGVCAP